MNANLTCSLESSKIKRVEIVMRWIWMKKCGSQCLGLVVDEGHGKDTQILQGESKVY